ncbi:hypothetical protein ADU37_CDS10520 [Thermococcus sp. 2319x1]|uniref:hypothetical protein n=1 Tax=Thermococcus sp. 2319x1 TaxID=1674923 RepID=UPI00073A67FF|nr:hypothetical protein [Thermococcus sp. 2319x1]ALV62751.1 hypothetical protein ADU37_CDS10520 [Thermococcus sp. 2319x1]
MALHEVLHGIATSNYCPKAILISSSEYLRSSIKGGLIKKDEIKARINRFAGRIIQKMG